MPGFKIDRVADIFSSDATKGLVLASLSNGAKTEEDLAVITGWLESIRADLLLLKMVFSGEVIVSVDDNEVAFSKP